MPGNRLVNANQAARCQHVKVNGFRCGSPSRHGRDFCCFHDSAARRNREFVLPIVEDAASLQLALNKIMQALIDKLIDQKTASILLYGLQIAFANLKQLKGEQRVDDFERMRQARRDQEQSTSATQSDPCAGTITDHPLAITNAPAPPSSAAAPDPVNEFLRKIANQKSQATNKKGPRFDINACADLICNAQSSILNFAIAPDYQMEDRKLSSAGQRTQIEHAGGLGGIAVQHRQGR